MRIVTFASRSGTERLGCLSDSNIVDLVAAADARDGTIDPVITDALAFLAAGMRGTDAANQLADWALSRGGPELVLPAASVRLLAPIPRPGKVLCLAANYAEHIREGGREAPAKERATPMVFDKPVTTIVGPEAQIVLPGPLCTAVDYEAELAAVIGTSAKNVPEERATEYVAGYANFNDVSGRSLNIEGPRDHPWTSFFDWLQGKWFDSFGPLGPYVAIGEIADPDALGIQCRVNGELRQNASTADMIFNVAEIIAWISRFVTLQPGDIVATGTPSGVGKPSGRFLKAGDVVEVEVSGLGVLRNSVASA